MYLSAGAVGKYGLEQLEAEERCASPAKWEDEIALYKYRVAHSFKLEGSDTHIHFIHYSHTHIQIHHKERRELGAVKGAWSCPGTSLLPSSSSSPLFILSMYFLFSVFIVMSN